MANAEEIEKIIDYDRDYLFDYFALTTLFRAYLLQFNSKVIERPQDLWMRVALCVSGDKFDFYQVKKLMTVYLKVSTLTLLLRSLIVV